jgi:uncharacterized protein (TIGR03067 family)
MKPYTLLLSVVALLVAVLAVNAPAHDGKQDAARQALMKLEGTWTLTALEMAGKAAPEEWFKEAAVKLVFEGGKATIYQGGKRLEDSLTLDPTKSPKQIDTRGTAPGGKVHTTRGIYRVERDTLTICLVTGGTQRPAEFKTQPGSDQVLYTFRRQKK